MAWDNADVIFPEGYAVLPDGTTINNEDLKESGIKTISRGSSLMARKMVVQNATTLWGDNGEYALITEYELNNYFPELELDVSPLSLYGKAMLLDHLTQNDIYLEKYNNKPFLQR